MTTNNAGPRLTVATDILLRDVLGVRQGESVLLAADIGTDPELIQSLQDSGYRLGAKLGTMILSPKLPLQGSLADRYLPTHLAPAMDASDVCIDLCFPYLAGSKAFDRALENGRTRYLLAGDLGAEQMTRLMAGVDLDLLIRASDAFSDYVLQSAGKVCRITNPDGTDVTFKLAKYEAMGLTKADKPGGYFMPGTVLFIPDLESVEGTIVTRHFFHEYYSVADEPITFKVKGKVQELLGGGPHRKVMHRALKRADKEGLGYVVHFTCGFHPAAQLTGKSFIEDQRTIGCNAVGLGRPVWEKEGGENHPDCVVSMQSIWVDGMQIVKDGVIIGPPGVREAMDRLKPLLD